ncbi:VOC family protein [Pedobacter hiemivivus]|uniref:Uncharacterized protein n=1 Tax=Pedobacter hiemivivus TaxID=2530454 RepID=A0A4R0N0A1_9SPHI|nr:hypothetical protein [Pedobacter hiemivivus]TCC93101.1 hypothetical protein EZ444_17730 [Pedobacter hiemivivus]
MALKQILPKVFYSDINVGLKFFIDGMGFTLGYHDDSLYIVNRDDITFLLVDSKEFAEGDRPEIRIATNDIEAIYQEIKDRAPEILHPNSRVVSHKPGGLRNLLLLIQLRFALYFSSPYNPY